MLSFLSGARAITGNIKGENQDCAMQVLEISRLWFCGLCSTFLLPPYRSLTPSLPSRIASRTPDCFCFPLRARKPLSFLEPKENFHGSLMAGPVLLDLCRKLLRALQELWCGVGFSHDCSFQAEVDRLLLEDAACLSESLEARRGVPSAWCSSFGLLPWP